MKKLLLLAALTLFLGTGATSAKAYCGCDTWQSTALSDSTQTKMEIEGTDKKGDIQTGESDEEETKGQTANKEKNVSIDELKAAAKRNNKTTKNKKVVKQATVSYPTYPGGNVAIREFVRKHQRYPEECKSERQRGRVEVTMTISWDGTPHSPKVTKSSGNEYMDAEALRIADMMPGWTPAEESDDPQDIEYTIFVNFRPGR